MTRRKTAAGRDPGRQLTGLAVALGLLVLCATAVQAAPLAGTTIGNQAAATYKDANGVEWTTTSNIVQTIVQQVASLTLTASQTVYAIQGGQVTFPHTLTNTGNGTDTYALTIAQVIGDNFDLNNVKIYADADGNGIPDDLTEITSTGPLVAGGVFKFVIVATVPTGVAPPQYGAITVTATSQFVETPTDLVVSATNTDTVNVTTGAVINVTKAFSSTYGASPSGPYTITLYYQNVGNAPATAVTLTDLLPAGLTYVLTSGLWSSFPTTPLTDPAGGDPTGISYDWNVTVTNRVTAVIAGPVAIGETGWVSFQVNVASGLQAGPINNTALVSYYDGATTRTGTSNTATFTVTQSADVTITGDTVEMVYQGGTATFTNTVTNTGNAVDTFDITIGTSTFPLGTTFTLYKSDGQSLLLDTNGNGIPDTGPLAPGASYEVILKATLPPGVVPETAVTVQKTATSYNDPNQYDTATDTLEEVVGNTVDLTNDKSIAQGAAAGDGLGDGPEDNPIRTVVAETEGIHHPGPWQEADFELYVNNTSAVPDTFILQASTDPSFSSLTLPTGVSVRFEDNNQTVISNTGVLAAGASFYVHVDVFFPLTFAPGTYNIYFRAISLTTGASDIKHDAVTVPQRRSLQLVPNNVGQTSPGGTVVYTHTITNTGNVLEGDGLASAVALSLTDTAAGWSSTVYWDKNNDGVLDPGDPVITDLSVLTGGTNGASTAAGLDPGESARLFVKVYAPPGATVGTADVTTVTATTSQGTYGTPFPPPAIATDTTTVVSGNVRMTKAQALDADCDGTPDTAYSEATITTGAVPGACVRYKVTITNLGQTPVSDVVINDTTPAYTVYDDGDATTSATGVASFTKDSGATYTAATAPADGFAGPISATVGTLAAGQSAVLYFGVKIVN